MRTAIFLGLTAVADSINKNWLTDPEVMEFTACMVMVMMAMDVVEFYHKIKPKK